MRPLLVNPPPQKKDRVTKGNMMRKMHAWFEEGREGNSVKTGLLYAEK